VQLAHALDDRALGRSRQTGIGVQIRLRHNRVSSRRQPYENSWLARPDVPLKGFQRGRNAKGFRVQGA